MIYWSSSHETSTHRMMNPIPRKKEENRDKESHIKIVKVEREKNSSGRRRNSFPSLLSFLVFSLSFISLRSNFQSRRAVEARVGQMPNLC